MEDLQNATHDAVTDCLQNILDHIAQGILFIELDGRITTCNKAAEAILGIQSQTVIFRYFGKVFKDDVFGFSMQKMLERQQPAPAICTNYNSPMNQYSELEIVTTFVAKRDKSSQNQNQGLIVMIRDVTEVHHLQMMAARADRMKILGEMAAQVAHEIRNPLGGIKGFASLLKRDLKDHPEQQKMAEYIVEGTDSLNHLVNQILNYTRPVQPHLENTDLIALLQQVKEHVMADTNIYKSNIAILIDAPFDTLMLSIDIAHFKSAILNLIVNAIQAMPEGGIISLSTRKKTGYIILTISDTGIGIADESLSKLYSPFFTTKPEGNGLGLIEVQKIIQAHGGTIDVRSAPEKGTAFTIKLPFK